MMACVISADSCHCQKQKTKNKQGGEQKSRYLHVTDLVVANVQHFEIGAFFQTVEAANVIVREP